MIDLSRIPDDRRWGVFCETEQELRELVDAIKSQRKDVDLGLFANPLNLAETKYHGKAFFLNYARSKRLQYGDLGQLPVSLITMKFEELLCAQDLPDIDASQLETLSMLGL